MPKPKNPATKNLQVSPQETGSLADQAYHQLEGMIVTLVLPPGAPLSPADLCAKRGIRRTPPRGGASPPAPPEDIFA